MDVQRERQAVSNESRFDADDETAAPRNPPWSRDELILALDLYLRFRNAPPGKDSLEVAGLSAFLGRMGRGLGLTDAETFRNANGVYMKMMNFRRFDPEYTAGGRVGLVRGNKDTAQVCPLLIEIADLRALSS